MLTQYFFLLYSYEKSLNTIKRIFGKTESAAQNLTIIFSYGIPLSRENLIEKTFEVAHVRPIVN